MEYLSICFPDSLPDHSVGKESACSPKGDQSWVFIGRTDAEAETPVLWPPDAESWLIWKDWCWERLRAGGEGDDRGWDGWLASPTQWTWVWVNSGSWWWTGRPGVLRFMGSQRVGQDWATKLNWSACNAEDPGSIPGLGRSAGEGTGYPLQYSWASLMAQLMKNLPAMRETWVWPLGWEDPLEKGKISHSSTLAWRIPWNMESMGSQFSLHFSSLRFLSLVSYSFLCTVLSSP